MVHVLHLAVSVEQKCVVHVERALVEIEVQRQCVVASSAQCSVHARHVERMHVEHRVHSVVAVAVVLGAELVK